MERIYVQNWLELPKDIRNHLAKKFNLTRTGIAEVRDQTVISDGASNDDLGRAFNKNTLNAYIGSDETFARGWEITISKAKFELNPPTMVGNGSDFDLGPIVDNGTYPSLVTPEVIELPPAKWCDFCDSKGIRHKMNCTKPGVVNGFEKKFDSEEEVKND